MKIEVIKKEARLDKFIAQNTEISRSTVVKMIEAELILVNGELKSTKSKLYEGDVIEILDTLKTPEIELIAQDLNLDIVYEDDDLIVVNKPSNMVVHPAVGHPDKTLVNGLLFHLNSLSQKDSIRPGIVHRIDKDTSGLLMVAKNDIAHEFLAAQLKDKTSHRKYVAIVHGILNEDEAVIDAPIGRDKINRQKMTVTGSNSKEAQTNIKVLERFINYTLIECELKTGRTHQIRVHLQYIKHQVVGDPVYGPKKSIDTKGQALHAVELGFIHPTTKEFMMFKAPLPNEFENTLKFIRENDGFTKI